MTLRLKLLFGLALAIAWSSRLSGGQTAETTLRSAATGLFDIGVGASDRIYARTNDWKLLLSQFSVITPENCMKPAAVQANEGEFEFETADKFVDFAASNGLKVVGHCLVWAKDDRTPPWFYKKGEGPASRQELLGRMKRHIQAVAGRYKGRIAMWDVVNEALDDGTNYLRPSGWSAACGEEFIHEAAHEADPKALLVYNDYNDEKPAKRAKLERLVRSMLQRHTPIDAIGLQGHFELDQIPFVDLEAAIVSMRNLGVKVVVSELDIDVIPRARWWADGGAHREEMAKLNPYRDGCPPEILKRQAEQYGRLFELFRKYHDTVVRITFWNLHDGESWLNYFPWTRVNYPLLFDRERKPKPAFDSVVRALGNR
jgi:endo-1,4-beta-xylanase